MRPSGKGGPDDEGPARRLSSLEARIADALATSLAESRFSETLMKQVLAGLTESRDVERLVIHLLRQPGVTGTVDELVDGQLDRVIPELRESEAVGELVQAQADRLLRHLTAHPEIVQQLVRDQVDLYLQHLTANPEPVRQLIRDQSRGMLRDVQATVRARAFLADDAVDAWVARLRRRK